MEGFRYIRWLPLLREKQKPNPRTRFSKSLNLTLCISPINRRFSNRFRFISGSKVLFALSLDLSHPTLISDFSRFMHLIQSCLQASIISLTTLSALFFGIRQPPAPWCPPPPYFFIKLATLTVAVRLNMLCPTEI